MNKEARNFPSYDRKIQLKTESGTTTNLLTLYNPCSFLVHIAFQ